MENRQLNPKTALALESFAILILMLSFVYLLDDVIQVLSLSGMLEDVVFYTFVIGPIVTLPLSLVCRIKFNLRRFSIYIALSTIQLLLIVAFTYILLNSQV